MTDAKKIDLQSATVRKAIAGFLMVTVMPIAIMFLAAGRIDWWEAWAMIVVIAVSIIGSRVILFRKHPELVEERARWTEIQNAKAWDKRLMPIVAVYGPMLVWFVAGLDKRWNASPPLSLELEIAAFVGVIAGYTFSVWALVENKFFSAVARIQTERGHTVVDTGPYRLVRHPGYAGGVIGYLLTPIALGALWTFVPSILTIIATVARTALEDKMLLAELPGYREYAARVRYRLLPGVW